MLPGQQSTASIKRFIGGNDVECQVIQPSLPSFRTQAGVIKSEGPHPLASEGMTLGLPLEELDLLDWM